MTETAGPVRGRKLRKRTKSEQLRFTALQPPPKFPSKLLDIARVHHVEKRFAESTCGRTPIPIVMDTDRIATEIFLREVKGKGIAEDPGISVEKPFHEDLMQILHAAVTQLVLLLEQYNGASVSIKKQYDRRTKEIWKELPKLATVGKRAAAKVAGIGLFGSIWGAVYLAIGNYVSQPVALIITAAVAFGGFFVANRTTVKIASSGLSSIDYWITKARKWFVRWRYSRKKVEMLQALATVVRSELDRVLGNKPPATKEERENLESQIENQDRSIKSLCSTLPNPHDPHSV